MILQTPKATASAATMVEPTGVPARIETRIPARAQTTERTAENTVTFLKLWHIRMADNAGKITRADIKRDPTRFMERTMITAVMTAIRRL